jgi:hypothetical protein
MAALRICPQLYNAAQRHIQLTNKAKLQNIFSSSYLYSASVRAYVTRNIATSPSPDVSCQLKMIQHAIFDARKKAERKDRRCIYRNCQNSAITSHVLQKNGILKQISENNHLIELKPPDPFKIEEQGISQFKLVGINNVYTFFGFCSLHDSLIFKPIESENRLDLYSLEQQSLFSYRGLCQEIRRKEIATEFLTELRTSFPTHMIQMVNASLDGFEDGMENLNYFKREFETCTISKSFDRFHFETIEIPKIDLCISVPLNIGELETRDKNETYEDWRKKKQLPFTTSFINVFPKGKHSYVIAGFHKDFPCVWTINFIARLQKGKKDRIFKELSDLITLRLEFWTMSPKLFHSIRKTDLEAYKSIFSENVFNHSPRLKTKINLFKKYRAGS